MKTLNERCKTYGLRAKPTTLLELPFGTGACIFVVLQLYVLLLLFVCTLSLIS